MKFTSIYLSESKASSLKKVVNHISGFVGKEPTFTKKVASGSLFVFNSVGSPMTLINDVKERLPGFKFKTDGSTDTVYKFHGPAGYLWATFMGPNAHFVLTKDDEEPSFLPDTADDVELPDEPEETEAGFSEMDPGDIGAAP